MNDDELVEKLAELEHKRWSNWQTLCHKILRERCPSEAMEKVLARWDKQIAMDYKDLSEREKEMDREEARKTLEVLSRHEAIEPLEKLAFRKGILYIQIWPFKDGAFEIDLKNYEDKIQGYVGDTYAEAEQETRAFLETLPDNAIKELK